MRKLFFTGIVTLVLSGACLFLRAQITISGPTCVVPGVVYTYKISSVLTAQATMQVCITGGNLAGRDTSVKLSNCTPDKGAPLSGVNVIWDSTGNTSLKATSGAATGSLNVTVTSPLSAGTINLVSKSQTISIDSLATLLTCSAAQGGSCNSSYTNQWQQSLNAVDWENIEGATTQNLALAAKLSQTMFYRKKTTEISSGTIAYSDVAVVFVMPAKQWADSLNSILPDSASTGWIPSFKKQSLMETAIVCSIEKTGNNYEMQMRNSGIIKRKEDHFDIQADKKIIHA